MSRFGYLAAEGIRAFWRARLPVLGSAMTIALTLMIFGGAYVILSNFDRATRRLQSQYRIDVFFDTLLSNQDAFRRHQNIKEIEGVSSIEFINKERAAEIFKKEFGEDVITVLGINPLPAGSVVLVARGYRTARRINHIADEISELPGVTDVAYRGELVRLLERYVQFAVYGGITLGIVALLAAFFLVSNTIKLSIYAKRESIETIYMLGGSAYFVRFPFLVEGILQGLIGSALAITAILSLLDVFNYVLGQFVLYRIITPPLLGAGLGILGVALGFFGSMRSIGRFIDPKLFQAK